jgi:hypothetical protein
MFGWFQSNKDAHSYEPVRDSSSGSRNAHGPSSVSGTSDYTTLHIDNRQILSHAREVTVESEELDSSPSALQSAADSAKAASKAAVTSVKGFFGQFNSMQIG